MSPLGMIATACIKNAKASNRTILGLHDLIFKSAGGGCNLQTTALLRPLSRKNSLRATTKPTVHGLFVTKRRFLDDNSVFKIWWRVQVQKCKFLTR